MKVYRIRSDVRQYQYFLPEREEDELKLFMDATPVEADWEPPPVFVFKPRHKAGDFYQFHSDILITSPRATAVLMEFLEMAGELLPLPYKGQVFTLLNVTECIDCLDHEQTEWTYAEQTGERIGIQRYVFHPDRFVSSRIFKIPETCRGEILVVDREQGEDEEVRSVIEGAQLQGLVFEELWRGVG